MKYILLALASIFFTLMVLTALGIHPLSRLAANAASAAQYPGEGVNRSHRGEEARQLALTQKRYVAAPGNNELLWEISQKEFTLGGLYQAAESLAPLLSDAAYVADATYLMANIHYLQGNYAKAEELYTALLQKEPNNPRGKFGLLYAYYQTNAYAKVKALSLTAKDFASHEAAKPLWDLMRSYGNDKPYQVGWKAAKTTIPFVSMNFLPVVSLKVNGRQINAFIDTGADLFTIDAKLAKSLGVKSVSSDIGVYAGGKTAQVDHGRLDSLQMGDVVLRSVPVNISEFPDWTFMNDSGKSIPVDAIVSTGLFQQFVATMNYLDRELVLYPRSADGRNMLSADLAKSGKVVEVPFIIESQHFMIIKGEVNGKPDMTFFLDSGLDHPIAAVLLQKEAIDYAGIDLKKAKTTHIGADEGGMGGGDFSVKEFTLERVELGDLRQTDVVGVFGILPPELYRTQSGMLLDGFISHQFLRHYKWAIDFDNMKMFFFE